MMKAIVCHAYGLAGLACEEVERPTAGESEVLLKVHAAAVNALDWHLLRGTPRIARLALGLRRPSTERPGRDVAGVVEAVGRKVTRFGRGDAVFGVCRGAFAEFACAAESSLVTKPGNVSFEAAAAVPVAGLTALQGLRDVGRIASGQQVLIHGAGGGVGSLAVQIAKAFGAEVTAVTSTANLATMEAIGADHVLDYTREDFTASGWRFDLIFDCYECRPLAAYRRVLVPQGRHVAAGGPVESITGLLSRFVARLVRSWLGSQTFTSVLARSRAEDLAVLSELLASGKLSPVIHRSYGLSEVSEAIGDLAAGRVRGKAVITV
jgi:NADPH:quinone reductase-like Zn-dependent oxidoreductase